MTIWLHRSRLNDSLDDGIISGIYQCGFIQNIRECYAYLIRSSQASAWSSIIANTYQAPNKTKLFLLETRLKDLELATAVPRGTPSLLERGCSCHAIFSNPKQSDQFFQRPQIIKRLN